MGLGQQYIVNDAYVCAGLGNDFTAIQAQCHKLGMQILEKAGDAFALVLKGLEAFQETNEAK